ncbi:hypothetical protein BN946_scf185043.g115 [Trametes cinnabarina]|uniref:WIBG Mago-binding domain-containing protein n=1 Tax=Pycnoporus cinnabarinus TaxID=5643 RepID=A0A060SI21_PYCCI|nr:hypothetical protein BN946_scf185043.g115 [Trametes cinnabarina]
MSKPPIVPETTPSGIAVDPRTLERVIPESRRPDGSVRKQLKVRPGFTPQEDIRRFRGTRQAQMDANSLPKGHIIGWAPPPQTAVPPASKAGLTKAQKKNEKRKEKRKEKRDETKVKDNWEDDDDGEAGSASSPPPAEKATSGEHTPENPNWAAASATQKDAEDAEAEGLADKLEKLEVR